MICPRITSEHTADVTDLGRFREYPAWKDKTGNDLALAVWQYLCDYETGLYHFNEILEGPDPFDEYATVRDPLKILNVYNMAYCGIFGPVLDGIYQTQTGHHTCIDLTPWVRGTYGYLLKLGARGPAGAPALTSLALDTWVQVAPISLPRLRRGDNHLTFALGDRYGKATYPILVTPNTADPADLKRYGVILRADYDPKRNTERIRGELILPLKAPENESIRLTVPSKKIYQDKAGGS